VPEGFKVALAAFGAAAVNLDAYSTAAMGGTSTGSQRAQIASQVGRGESRSRSRGQSVTNVYNVQVLDPADFVDKLEKLQARQNSKRTGTVANLGGRFVTGRR
jgi:hypothetical protein